MISKFEAYSELYFILKQVPYSYYACLPDFLINELEEKMSINHYKKFDLDKTFYSQKIDEKTINYLEKIYKNYWNKTDSRINNFKSEKFNPEDLFKRSDLLVLNNIQNNNNETTLIKYKESFFKRLKIFFINIFKRKY